MSTMKKWKIEKKREWEYCKASDTWNRELALGLHCHVQISKNEHVEGAWDVEICSGFWSMRWRLGVDARSLAGAQKASLKAVDHMLKVVGEFVGAYDSEARP